MSPMVSAIYGLMAEFAGPTELVEATRKAYAAGYRKMDAYSPFPIHELDQALGLRRTRLPAMVLFAGVMGCLLGFGMQYWCSKISYPLNAGGKPFNSWPAFIPITFELTVLLAALTAVAGMIALNGLPMPYHPVFNVPSFELASKDRFFLCIEASDPKFDLSATRDFLTTLSPREVTEVAH